MKIVAPNRVARSYRQRLVGEPARVFELLCPVREADWIEGWDPALVVSRSGWVEPDCVFVTAAGARQAIWVVTRHEPATHHVEMIKVTPEVTVCKLTIDVVAAEDGSEAQVTYEHTSLGPEGDAFIAAFTEAHYRGAMRDWEARMNHYLRAGRALHLENAP